MHSIFLYKDADCFVVKTAIAVFTITKDQHTGLPISQLAPTRVGEPHTMNSFSLAVDTVLYIMLNFEEALEVIPREKFLDFPNFDVFKKWFETGRR